MALNKAIIMGRITHDLELRSTPSGTSVLQFSLAVERNFVKQGEERQTDFINCVAWKQTAEFIGRFFGKGRLIAIEGRLQSRNYEDKQGNKRTAIEVIVDQASFTGEPKKDGGGQQTAPQDEYNDIDVLSDDGVPF